MIKNIPNKYTSEMLKEDIDHFCKDQYDILYLVMDFNTRCNVGYAFINFIDPIYVIGFFEKFNKMIWPRFKSLKVIFTLKRFVNLFMQKYKENRI